MSCGTRNKLHACIQAVINVNCYQNSETRHLITQPPISQMSKRLSSRLREKVPFATNLSALTASHYEHNHYNILHMFSRVSSFLYLLSSYLGFRRCVSFRPFSYSTVTAKHRSPHTLPSLTRHLRQVSGFAFRSSSYTDKVYSWYL